MGYYFPSASRNTQTFADYFVRVSGGVYTAVNQQGSTIATGTVFSTVLNAVIAACTAPAKIYISAGTYTVTTSIVDGGIDNIELELAPGAKLFLGNNADTHVISLTDCENWYIHGGEIDGNKTNQTTPGGAANTNSYGISLYQTNNVRIKDMYIHDCCRAGIHTYGNVTTQCTDTLIVDCNISDNNWSGYLPDQYTYGCIVRGCLFTGDGEGGIGGGTASPLQDITIDSCTQHDMNGAGAPVGYEAGIYIEAGTRWKVVNNHIYNCKVGIFVTADGDHSNVIANNTIHDCSGNSECPGILCKSYRTIIANNQVNHAVAFKPGILVGSGTDHFGSEDIIIGNVVIGSTNSNGIQVVRSDNVIVANNFIAGGTNKGIQLMTNSSNCNVHGNRIKDAATGIDVDNANCLRNFFDGNNMDGCTDAMTDSGTNTRWGDNLNQAGAVVSNALP